MLLQPACFRCGGSGPLPFLQVFRNFNYKRVAEPLTCSKSNVRICLLAAIAEVLSIAWHVRLQPT